MTLAIIWMVGVLATFQNQRAATYVVRALFLVFVWACLYAIAYSVVSLIDPTKPGTMPMGPFLFAWVASLGLMPLFTYFYMRRWVPRPVLESWIVRLQFLLLISLRLYQIFTP